MGDFFKKRHPILFGLFTGGALGYLRILETGDDYRNYEIETLLVVLPFFVLGPSLVTLILIRRLQGRGPAWFRIVNRQMNVLILFASYFLTFAVSSALSLGSLAAVLEMTSLLIAFGAGIGCLAAALIEQWLSRSQG
ncbi:MAG: hypothetical protein AAGE89_04725 [Pseudomonadota bacterium]